MSHKRKDMFTLNNEQTEVTKELYEQDDKIDKFNEEQGYNYGISRLICL